MPRVDDAPLALGCDDVVAELRHDIAKPRLGIDSNGLARGISVNSAIGRAAKAGDLGEIPPPEPASEVELLSVLAVGMDTDVPCALRAQQMHRVGDHDGAFVKMMFVEAI